MEVFADNECSVEPAKYHPSRSVMLSIVVDSKSKGSTAHDQFVSKHMLGPRSIRAVFRLKTS